MSQIRAGDLRHRVLLQERSTTKDTSGQEVQTWTYWLEVWGSIEPLSGRELIAAQAVNSEVTHTIMIRYRPGITPRMRAVYGERTFEIHSVIDVEEKHHALNLLCTEGLTQG